MEDAEFMVDGEAVSTAQIQGEQQALALEQQIQQKEMADQQMQQQQAMMQGGAMGGDTMGGGEGGGGAPPSEDEEVEMPEAEDTESDDALLEKLEKRIDFMDEQEIDYDETYNPINTNDDERKRLDEFDSQIGWG